MSVTVTAEAEPTTGRMRVTAEGGRPGDVLYLLRRDESGVGVVRDTSAGTITWPPTGELLATNLVPNAELEDANGDGATDGLLVDAGVSAQRDTAHALPGGAGWSVRLTWIEPSTKYPSSTAYPSTDTYPQGA